MKKYILLIFTLSIILPVQAACPISGICSSDVRTQVLPSGIQDKYLPNRLENIQNPNNFAPKRIKSYDTMKMNAGEPATEYNPGSMTPNPLYDCQFGICPP